jgi:serine protease Do
VTRLPIIIVVLVLVAGAIDRFLFSASSEDPKAPRREQSSRRPNPDNFDREIGGMRRQPQHSPRRPAAPQPGGRRGSLPGGGDVLVNIPQKTGSAIGTAFSIDDRGTWFTARHVADGCQKLYVITGRTNSGRRKGLRVQKIYIHRSADLAVMQTKGGRPIIALTSKGPRQGMAGYHFGFPAGKPASVSSTLIGRRTMRSRGRYRADEPVLVWAERVRVPDSYGGLGGISGGPALDAQGRLIGVTVAGSKRRGRVFTTAMSSVQAALSRARVSARTGSKEGSRRITDRNFSDYGNRLRRRLSVALVYCLVPRTGSGNPRRPRY